MNRKRPSGATAEAGTDHQALSIEPMYLEVEVAEMLRVRLKVIQRER